MLNTGRADKLDGLAVDAWLEHVRWEPNVEWMPSTSNASIISIASPVTRPYESVAPPLSILLFVPAWTEGSSTHPE